MLKNSKLLLFPERRPLLNQLSKNTINKMMFITFKNHPSIKLKFRDITQFLNHTCKRFQSLEEFQFQYTKNLNKVTLIEFKSECLLLWLTPVYQLKNIIIAALKKIWITLMEKFKQKLLNMVAISIEILDLSTNLKLDGFTKTCIKWTTKQKNINMEELWEDNVELKV